MIENMYRVKNHSNNATSAVQQPLGNRLIDVAISMFLISLFSPVLVLNCLFAKLRGMPITKNTFRQDCVKNYYSLTVFSAGVFTSLGLLFNVLKGEIALFGLPTSDQVKQSNVAFPHIMSSRLGIFNGIRLNAATGLELDNTEMHFNRQLSLTGLAYMGLIARCALAHCIYRSETDGSTRTDKFTLFGINICNVSMSKAIDWILSPAKENQEHVGAKVGCFVNVNSVNLSASVPALTDALNQADCCFADGSGMRLAARKIGVHIKANVNGTDLMPLLCEQLVQQKKSVYLLGGEPGVAEKAAEKLIVKYPKLKIVGIRHGYFDTEDCEDEIARINHSKPDVLLVAMGSPVQERWLIKNGPLLKCNTALAVGGLLDFYAAKYRRAPLWMRELGFEWIWRLFQDPKTKFYRYVIGNPIFLFRTYLTRTVKRGF